MKSLDELKADYQKGIAELTKPINAFWMEVFASYGCINITPLSHGEGFEFTYNGKTYNTVVAPRYATWIKVYEDKTWRRVGQFEAVSGAKRVIKSL